MGQKHEHRTGWFVLITAEMYGGKTETLIYRALLYERYVGLFATFKPEADTRNGAGIIKSKSGSELKIEAYEIPAENPHVILEKMREFTSIRCAVIDEIQFFDSEQIVVAVKELLNEGFSVIAAGLDLDFRGLPFGGMSALINLVKEMGYNGRHIPLYAHCCVCGRLASRTQRLTKEGEPAPANDPVVVIEKDNNYEPRCIDCYVEPR